GERGGGSHNQGIVSITHTPGFPPADIGQCGPALVVYGHDREAAELAADRIAGAIRERERDFAGKLYEAGAGALLGLGVGAKIGYAGETPVEARWRIERVESGDFVGTGPMFGGAKFHIGPMALLRDEDSGVRVVLASKRIQAVDQEQFRHVGIEPAQVPILALKLTVHFRADFQPIAETILVVQSPGAHVTDPVELPYRHLRTGVRLRPMGPEHR